MFLKRFLGPTKTENKKKPHALRFIDAGVVVFGRVGHTAEPGSGGLFVLYRRGRCRECLLDALCLLEVEREPIGPVHTKRSGVHAGSSVRYVRTRSVVPKRLFRSGRVPFAGDRRFVVVLAGLVCFFVRMLALHQHHFVPFARPSYRKTSSRAIGRILGTMHGP